MTIRTDGTLPPQGRLELPFATDCCWPAPVLRRHSLEQSLVGAGVESKVSLLAQPTTHASGHKRSIATGSFREPQLDCSTVHRMPGWKVGSISRLSNLRDAPVNERLRSCGH